MDGVGGDVEQARSLSEQLLRLKMLGKDVCVALSSVWYSLCIALGAVSGIQILSW